MVGKLHCRHESGNRAGIRTVRIVQRLFLVDAILYSNSSHKFALTVDCRKTRPLYCGPNTIKGGKERWLPLPVPARRTESTKRIYLACRIVSFRALDPLRYVTLILYSRFVSNRFICRLCTGSATIGTNVVRPINEWFTERLLENDFF